VSAPASEGHFTREELIKLRQRKPPIRGNYKIEKIKLSNYQKAVRDIQDIHTMIDVL